MLMLIGWIALFAIPRWWALAALAAALAAFKIYMRYDIMQQMAAQGIVVDSAFMERTIVNAGGAALVFLIVGAGIVFMRRANMRETITA